MHHTHALTHTCTKNTACLIRLHCHLEDARGRKESYVREVECIEFRIIMKSFVIKSNR